MHCTAHVAITPRNYVIKSPEPASANRVILDTTAQICAHWDTMVNTALKIAPVLEHLTVTTGMEHVSV